MIAAVLLLLLGDTLHLKSGGKVEGKIVSADGSAYKVQVATGTVTIPKENVEKVDFGPSPAEILAERTAKLDRKNTKDVVELAKWAQSKGFLKEALELARSCDDDDCRRFAASLIEPEVVRRLEEARKAIALGLTRRGRELVTALERDYPEAKDRARALLPSDKPVRRPAVDAALAAAVNEWFEKGTPLKTGAAVADIVNAIRFGARPKGGETGDELERKTPEDVPYLLRVPKTYDPAKPMRLLISLHGSGGSARMAMMCWRDGFNKEADLLVAAPEGGLPGWGNSRAGHDRILGVVRDVAAHYNVDLDRVCLEGGSMGAHGSFFLAMYYPDRWAAIAPRCGSARFVNQKSSGGVPDISAAPAMLDNLWRTPVYLIAGAKDLNSPIEEVRITKKRLEGLGAPIVYREYEEGGHAWFPDEDRDVLDFLRSHRRDPYPSRVKYVTRDNGFGRSHWVEIVEASRPTRVEITHVDMDLKPIEKRKEYEKPVEVDAECDRAKNRVVVRASGARELRIWLSDELLDLDRPVRVVVNNDTLFDGRVERSIQGALEDCRRRRDRGLVYPASVTVKLK